MFFKNAKPHFSILRSEIQKQNFIQLDVVGTYVLITSYLYEIEKDILLYALIPSLNYLFQ